MNILLLIIPLLAGIGMAVQGSINSQVGKIMGDMEGNLLVHLVGLIVILILLFVFKVGNGDLANYKNLPWWGYLGGIINVGIIYGVIFSIGKCGAANATTAILIGQIVMAMIIDGFGLFGLEKVEFSWINYLGLIFFVIGGKLLLGR